MYKSTNSRFSSDPHFIQEYISVFLKWMSRYVEVSDTEDAFLVLADYKVMCTLIIRVCPVQALIGLDVLNEPGTDIAFHYNILCDRLGIPVDYRLKPEIFMYHDLKSLYNCLQSLISSLILYADPSTLQLPSILVDHLSNQSSRSSYSESYNAYSISVSSPAPVQMNPHVYYSHPQFEEDTVSSSLPSILDPSLDSDGRTSVISHPANAEEFSGIPGMGGSEQPIFTPVQVQNQNSRQHQFLKALEEDIRTERELSVDKEEQARFSSNQLGSPRDTASHRSVNSEEVNRKDSEESIAEEKIELRDRHVEKQEERKSFWKKVAAVGATVGVVAGAVLAIAAATKGHDDTDSD